MSYIHYDKKSDGTEYASVYQSYREKGKVKTKRLETLGRVLDKSSGIFRDRKGVFQFTVATGRGPAPEEFQSRYPNHEAEQLILDFGDSWFLKEYAEKLSFFKTVCDILPEDKDTIVSLLFYRLLTGSQASCHAKVWYEGNFACLAFPKANLSSQNISRVLKKLGREHVQRSFFEQYLRSLYPNSGKIGILIDSTGVPNATKMDMTQLSNHNGDIEREVRVIYVIDRNRGMPIYFRYVAGNIVDVSTLITTVYELQQYGVCIEHAIVDAGYFSEQNALDLIDSKIPFLTRLAPNKALFKQAAKENLELLMSQKHAYRYGKRIVFIKKVPSMLNGRNVFVYLCIDEDTYLMQHKKTILTALEDKKDSDETDKVIKSLGSFALFSSTDIKEEQLLPLYYTRQQVEQVFDISKNYAGMLPIRVQSEEAFAGHMLLCFISTTIIQSIQQELINKRSAKAKSLNAESLFVYLRNQKCKVYKDYAIPQEARKQANAIYDVFNVQVPKRIPIAS